jgi:hypothetical protein
MRARTDAPAPADAPACLRTESFRLRYDCVVGDLDPAAAELARYEAAQRLAWTGHERVEPIYAARQMAAFHEFMANRGGPSVRDYMRGQR